MLPCTGKRSQGHTILHVSFGNSFGLASAQPPHRVCRVRQKVAEVRGNDDLSWDDLLQCWLGFFDGVRSKVVEDLDRLHRDFHLCLLSNTNPFIMSHTKSKAFTAEGRPITDFFDTLFLSYEMGICKPDARIFLKALEIEQMKADECLFIDDSKKNTDAAEKVGIRTLFVPSNSDWMPALEERLKELDENI